MEARILVSLWLYLAGCATVTALASEPKVAVQNATPTYSSHQQIRFYKVNRQGQTTRIQFAASKGRRDVCQNFLKKTRVYQANQFGFAKCRLYARKGCAPESLILATRAKDSTPVSELSAGYSWILQSEHMRGAKVRSWQCSKPATH